MNNFNDILDNYQKKVWITPELIQNNFYHYTDFDSGIKILTSKEFWISRYDFFKDRNEYKKLIKYFLKYFEKQSSAIDYRVRSNMIKFFRLEAKDLSFKPFVFSFTNSKNSCFHWKNYAKTDGVCFEFEKKVLSKLIPCNHFSTKVQYEEVQVNQCAKKLMDEFSSAISSCINNNLDLSREQEIDLIRALMGSLVIHSGLYKEERYKEELEQRFIYLCNKKTAGEIVKASCWKSKVVLKMKFTVEDIAGLFVRNTTVKDRILELDSSFENKITVL